MTNIFKNEIKSIKIPAGSLLINISTNEYNGYSEHINGVIEKIVYTGNDLSSEVSNIIIGISGTREIIYNNQLLIDPFGSIIYPHIYPFDKLCSTGSPVVFTKYVINDKIFASGISDIQTLHEVYIYYR